MTPVEPLVKKRRVCMAQLDSIVGQIPNIVNALDVLSTDSDELVRLCEIHNIPLAYQDVQSLKAHISVTLVSKQVDHYSPAGWDILPDLLPSPAHHPLPRQVFFGVPELDALFPSLPHPSFLELQETKQYGSCAPPTRVSHQVAMTLALASAARGARVLLVDTGLGTSIEQLLLQKCTVFCQTQQYTSDSAIEQLLERISVQRCYDPFSLLTVLTLLPTLPLQDQPDVVILMDWMKLTLPFMTAMDVLQHGRQFGVFGDFGGRGSNTAGGEGKKCSEASLRPLLAEVVLSLQRLTVPRTVLPAPSPRTISTETPHNSLSSFPVPARESDPVTTEKKSTSVVVLSALYHSTEVGSHTSISNSSNGSACNIRGQSPFGYLLTDSVDYSVWLGGRDIDRGHEQDVVGGMVYSAEIKKSPDMVAGNSKTAPNSFCWFRL